MTSSLSGQDEPNRALWLATRAGKMEPSCPLGTTRCIPKAKFHQKPYNKSFIDQVCSVKMAGYWPRSFFASLWTSTSSRSINTQKKELGQYPTILTSHLVNNPYVLTSVLLCVFSLSDQKWRSYIVKVAADVQKILTKLWLNLWSTKRQTHDNMTSICFWTIAKPQNDKIPRLNEKKGHR